MATFHFFPQLAPELRRAIWRICLPYRTLEMDVPTDQVVFDVRREDLSPCNLYDTTYMNLRPPLISRVCRESRDVAFETGHFQSFSKDRPDNTTWVSQTSVNYIAWKDTARDSYHLNWSSVYSAEYGGFGNPLRCLAWEAARVRRGGSMMFSFLDNYHYDYKSPAEMIEDLGQLPSWILVIRVVIVHSDLRTAAATGLFGLLGDERVQLVDVSDKARIDEFLDLGTKSGCGIVHVSEERLAGKQFGAAPFTYTFNVQEPYSTDREEVSRDPADVIKQRLREFIVKMFGSENKVPPMYPAIMFRLCTSMCELETPLARQTRNAPGGRGRGRGRGRGGIDLARGCGRGGA